MKSRHALVAIGALMALFTLDASASSAAPSDQDATWMVAAHQSNLAEIAAGTSATQHATTQTVRDLGQMLIDHHTRLDADLQAAAEQLDVTLPNLPTPEQQAALRNVEAQPAEEYDQAWVASQISGHEQTLAATQAEITTGTNPSVVALAAAAEPVITEHLRALQAMSDEGAADLPGTGANHPGQIAVIASAILTLGVGLVVLMRRANSLP